eukprot:1154227-Prymnesium_polylepis.2
MTLALIESRPPYWPCPASPATSPLTKMYALRAHACKQARKCLFDSVRRCGCNCALCVASSDTRSHALEQVHKHAL